MRTKLILGLLTLGFTFLISYVVLNFNSNNNTDTGLIQMVNEALLRVPLPPIPEKNTSGTIKFDNLELASSTYKRELFGIETVTEAVDNPTEECHTSFIDPYECYANYLTFITEQDGVAEAFIKIKQLYNAEDSYATSQCHQLTHIIGRAAATKFSTIGEAYNYGDTFCWSGYYHGVMEAIIADIGIENIPNRLNDICADIPGKDSYSFDYFNCIHGLGHGAMYVSGHELFNALELCDLLTDFWERESCYGGVYMENVIANDVDHISNYLKPENLLYPCDTVDFKYKNQCYLMQTSYMLRETGYNFTAVFQLCGTVENEHRSTCYQSLGRDASGSTLSNKEATANICLSGPTDQAIQNCIIGAVKDFISYFHSDIQGNELCQSLPSDISKICDRTVKNYYASF